VSKKNKIIIIGNFDGLHIGHRRILYYALNKAKTEDLKSIAVTFWPHPNIYMGKKLKLIQSLEERKKMIEDLGIEKVDIILFKNIVNFSPEDFFGFLTERHKNINTIVVGEEFRFGYKREGDLTKLKKIANKKDIKIKAKKVVELFNKKVSSSLIRKYLLKGKLQRARLMLGGFYSVSGIVKKGKRRGRRLNFPTANITCKNNFLLPPGVYVTRTLFNGYYYNSLTHVGEAPTFNDEEKKIETFIFNFNSNIYGKIIKVFFIKSLRKVKKFKTNNELNKALIKDYNYSKNYFNLF